MKTALSTMSLLGVVLVGFAAASIAAREAPLEARVLPSLQVTSSGAFGSATIPPFQAYNSNPSGTKYETHGGRLLISNVLATSAVRVDLTFYDHEGDIQLETSNQENGGMYWSRGGESNYVEYLTGTKSITFDLDPLDSAEIHIDQSMGARVCCGFLEYEILTPGVFGPALVGTVSEQWNWIDNGEVEARVSNRVAIKAGRPF